MIKDAKKAKGGKIEYDEFILVTTNRLMMYNMYGAYKSIQRDKRHSYKAGRC